MIDATLGDITLKFGKIRGNTIAPMAGGLPNGCGGPVVDNGFWRTSVAPAGVGPIERGCAYQVAAMRAVGGVGYKVQK